MKHHLARNKYGEYLIPDCYMHTPVAKTLMRGDVWEQETLDIIEAHVKEHGGSIIHAGTFFGDMLPALCNMCRPAWVFAYEPNPVSHKYAALNRQINSIDNLALHSRALSSGSGYCKMVMHDGDKALGGRSHISDADGATSICTTTIDAEKSQEWAARISVIHLDLEGHEPQALQGTTQLITRDKPLIIVETLPPASWLDAMGYHIAERCNANYVLRPA